MVELFAEGEHGLVTGTRLDVVGVGESRRRGVFVAARRVFVRIGELRDGCQGNLVGCVRASRR